jgi:amino acid transporter
MVIVLCGGGGLDDQQIEPPGLRRTMYGFGALLITLSCLSPTIGVFVVGSDVIRQAGSATFLCFAAAALLGVAMANVYAELAAAFPETGGEYTIIGRTLGPALGFAALGLNLASFSIAQALSGLGVAGYLSVLAPGLPAVPTALVLVAIVTGVAVLNIRVNALITGLFLTLELSALTLVTLLGLLHPHRAVSEIVFHAANLGAHGGLTPVPLVVFGVAAASAVYAFDGYGSVVFLGEDMHDAPRRVARVVFWTLGLAALTELLPVLGVLVGASDLKALIASPTPVAQFVLDSGGPWVAKAMSIGVALAIFNAMIAMALMAGRQLFSTGRDRVWPAPISRALARTHARFHSPWAATLAMGATSLAWCFVDLKLLVIVIANGTAVVYAGLCVAAIVGRRGGATAHAPYRMPLFPLYPIAALIALGGVMWADASDSDGRAGLIATIAIIVGWVLYYWLVLKGRGAWAHRGPHEPATAARIGE